MKMAKDLACEAFSSSPFFSFLTRRNTSNDKVEIGPKADAFPLEEWLGGVIIFAHIALRLKLRAQWYRANTVICLQSSVWQIKNACVWRDGSGLPVGQQRAWDAFWTRSPCFRSNQTASYRVQITIRRLSLRTAPFIYCELHTCKRIYNKRPVHLFKI